MNNGNLNTNNVKDSMSKLSSVLKDTKFVPAKYEDTEVDKDLYNWYLSRFRLCKEDGVMININAYLVKLQNETCNDYTKQRINLCAMSIISGGDGDEI